jgi:hypothetical protein
MQIVATLVFELVGVVVTILAVQFVILAARNPKRPRWLEVEWVQAMVAVAIVTIGCFSIGLLVAGMVAAGLDLFPTLVIALVFTVVVAWASARILGFRARLERADAGQSPFFH